MTPMISNTGETRFLFGIFVNAASVPVFHGAVIHGVNFIYNPMTRRPIGGTVTRIDVQTRSVDRVLNVHASFPDINTTVADLNADFENTLIPWYDATDILKTCDLNDSVPLDLNVELDSAQMAELVSGKQGLHLKTGEVLSAQEISGIFGVNRPKATRKKRAKAKRPQRANDPTVLLNAIYENASNSNFSDLDIDALEQELRIGNL